MMGLLPPQSHYKAERAKINWEGRTPSLDRKALATGYDRGKTSAG
jgi:hypothetical protein